MFLAGCAAKAKYVLGHAIFTAALVTTVVQSSVG